MLSRFNKFLIKSNYAEACNNWESVRLSKLFDIKKITKDFNKNEKLIKRYYALRKSDLSKASTLVIRNNILFY